MKVLKLVAASAVLCGRVAANLSDLWVLRYVWDREEQIGPLGALIGGVIELASGEPATHPLAVAPEKVDGQALPRQLDAAESESCTAGLSLAAVARLRERVADLADKAAWIADDAARAHLVERTGRILDRSGL